MRVKRVAVLVAVALCAAVAVRGAGAQSDSAFACYSVWENDPGVWPSDDPTVFRSWDAYASSYWAPFAETSIPTAERVGGYYLTCALPAGWAATGRYLLGNGADVTADSVYFVGAKPIPGVYPVIAPGWSEDRARGRRRERRV